MKITVDQLTAISRGRPVAANMASIVLALDAHGARFGLDQPHRLAHYIPQMAHESAGFRYDREIASGAAYEGRKDLGNTKRGDGRRYKGRGPMQITGRANYRRFTAWAKKFAGDAPDFEADPEAVNTDPWEGLGPIWYWDDGNPDPKGRSLNHYADRNDIEMITRRINGGLNGYADRLDYYDRTALVLLGYPVNGVRPFQEAAKRRGDYHGVIDGLSGPQTRAAMHLALVVLTDAKARPAGVQAAPVTEEKPVVPPQIEKEVKQGTNWISSGLLSGGVATGAFAWLQDASWQEVAIVGGGGLVAAIAVLLGGTWMVRRIKAIKQELHA